MVHATAIADHPVRQGMYGLFEVFVDTIVICFLTALAILTSGVLTGNPNCPVPSYHFPPSSPCSEGRNNDSSVGLAFLFPLFLAGTGTAKQAQPIFLI